MFAEKSSTIFSFFRKKYIFDEKFRKDAKWDFEAATRSGNSRKVTLCRLSPVAASRRNEFLEVPYNAGYQKTRSLGFNRLLPDFLEKLESCIPCRSQYPAIGRVPLRFQKA